MAMSFFPDILGTESDAVFREIENDVEKSLIAEAVSHLPDREKLIINMRFGLSGFRENTQSRWQMRWASLKAIFPPGKTHYPAPSKDVAKCYE